MMATITPNKLNSSLILRSSAIIVAGLMLTRLGNFIVRAVLARSLGPYEYGIIATVWSFTLILSVSSAPGIAPMVTRFLSGYLKKGEVDKAKGLVLSTARWTIFLSLFLSAVAIILSPWIAERWLGSAANALFLRVGFSAIVPWAALLWAIAIFRGLQHTADTVLCRDIVKNGLTLSMLVLLSSLSLLTIKNSITYIYLLPTVFSAIFALVLLFRRSKHHLNHNSISMDRKAWLQYAWPLSLSTLLQNVAGRSIDILLIGFLTSPEVVGIYSVALALANLGGIMMQGVNYIALPVMTGEKEGAAAKNYFKSRLVSFELTFPGIMVLMLWPRLFLHLLFGGEYASAKWIVTVLLVGFLFSNYIGPIGQLLLAKGHTRIHFLADTISILTFITLGLVLVPHFGAFGCALARLVSHISFNLVCTFPFIRDGRIQLLQLELFKYPFMMLSIGLIVKLFERNLQPFENSIGPIQFASVATVLVLCTLIVMMRAKTLRNSDGGR
jgi:O-antigen/teichoic acid export membrane protein